MLNVPWNPHRLAEIAREQELALSKPSVSRAVLAVARLDGMTRERDVEAAELLREAEAALAGIALSEVEAVLADHGHNALLERLVAAKRDHDARHGAARRSQESEDEDEEEHQA